MSTIEITDLQRITLSCLIQSHLKFIDRELGGDDRVGGEIVSALKDLNDQLGAI